MSRSLPLSDAKARLSEVVRTVRKSGTAVVITVDGEPAVQLAPIPSEPRELTPAEVATDQALAQAVLRIRRSKKAFDAVALIREGRR